MSRPSPRVESEGERHGARFDAYDVRALLPASWEERARCRGADVELFFPGKHDSAVAAKRLCRACDVRPECLAMALEAEILVGVWGGTTKFERDRMRGKRRPNQRPNRETGRLT